MLETEGGTPVLVAEQLALNQNGRRLSLTGRSPAMGNGQ
ncbi:hypothetical protein KLK06_48820 [Nonomuraea sp. NEAU-A123]|nr:hypothetical protein [Nonomuraea sp. NEAU-A123]